MSIHIEIAKNVYKLSWIETIFHSEIANICMDNGFIGNLPLGGSEIKGFRVGDPNPNPNPLKTSTCDIT